MKWARVVSRRHHSQFPAAKKSYARFVFADALYNSYPFAPRKLFQYVAFVVYCPQITTGQI